jgi:hypothetical protein
MNESLVDMTRNDNKLKCLSYPEMLPELGEKTFCYKRNKQERKRVDMVRNDEI